MGKEYRNIHNEGFYFCCLDLLTDINCLSHSLSTAFPFVYFTWRIKSKDA
jgi:hypothetical protein